MTDGMSMTIRVFDLTKPSVPTATCVLVTPVVPVVVVVPVCAPVVPVPPPLYPDVPVIMPLYVFTKTFVLPIGDRSSFANSFTSSASKYFSVMIRVTKYALSILSEGIILKISFSFTNT